MKRVVVTGMAALTPLGNNWEENALKLKGQVTGIQKMNDWEKYKGLNTHSRAIQNKDKFTGCSVHYVTEQLDSGKIILQKKKT